MRKSSPRIAALLFATLALVACNTREALNPAAIQPVDPPLTLAAPDPQPPPQVAGPGPALSPPTAPAPPTAAVSNASIQFAPVVGATVEAAMPLSRRLTARAIQRGLVIAGGGGMPTHLIKGYFSAIAEGKETIVIFVWDVLGPSGNRLHRIQGQERVAATATDAWAAVPPQTMETIADRTIDQLAQWLASHPT